VGRLTVVAGLEYRITGLLLPDLERSWDVSERTRLLYDDQQPQRARGSEQGRRLALAEYQGQRGLPGGDVRCGRIPDRCATDRQEPAWCRRRRQFSGSEECGHGRICRSMEVATAGLPLRSHSRSHAKAKRLGRRMPNLLITDLHQATQPRKVD
jgi:hypothetical protein